LACSVLTTEPTAGMLLAETDTDATEHPADLDSHAGTCIVGKNALAVHLLKKKVNMTGFDQTLGKVKDPDRA
jgi:hypothetical protein